MGLIKDLLTINKIRSNLKKGLFEEAFELINGINTKTIKDKWIFEWQLKSQEFELKLDLLEQKEEYEGSLRLLSTLFENRYSEKYITAYKDKLYYQAINEKHSGNVDKAKKILESIIEYKNCLELLEDCINKINHRTALEFISQKKYKDAIEILNKIQHYKDSKDLVIYCTEKIMGDNYEKAMNLLKEGKLDDSAEILSSISDYKDSKEILKKIYENKSVEETIEEINVLEIVEEIEQPKIIEEPIYIEEQNISEIVEEIEQSKMIEEPIYIEEQNISEIIEEIEQSKIIEEPIYIEEQNISEIVEEIEQPKIIEEPIFIDKQENDQKEQIEKFEESIDNNYRIYKEKYDLAIKIMNQQDYEQAISIFKEIYSFQDSKNYLEICEKKVLEIKIKKNKKEEEIITVIAEAFNSLNFSDAIKELEKYEWLQNNEIVIKELKNYVWQLDYSNISEELIPSFLSFIYYFKNSSTNEFVKETIIKRGKKLIKKGQPVKALLILNSINSYGKAKEYILRAKETILSVSKELINNRKYEDAIENLKIIENYKNSKELIHKCEDKLKIIYAKECYAKGVSLLNNGEIRKAIEHFATAKKHYKLTQQYILDEQLHNSHKIIDDCNDKLKTVLFDEKKKYIMNSDNIEYKDFGSITIALFENIKTRKNVFCALFYNEREIKDELYLSLAKSKLETIKKEHTFLLIDSEFYIIYCDNNELINEGFHIFVYQNSGLSQISSNEFENIRNNFINKSDIDDYIKTIYKKTSDIIECVKAYTGELELYKSTSEKVASICKLIDESFVSNKDLKVLIQGAARSGKTIIALIILRKYSQFKFLLMNYYFYLALRDAFNAKNLDFPENRIYHHDIGRDHKVGCGISVGSRVDKYKKSFIFPLDYIIVDEAQRLCDLKETQSFSGFNELSLLTLYSKTGIFLGDDYQKINPEYDEGFTKIIDKLNKNNRHYYCYEFDGSIGIPSNIVNSYKYILYDDINYFDNIEKNKIVLFKNEKDFINDFKNNKDDSKHYSTLTGYRLSDDLKKQNLSELPWDLRSSNQFFLNNNYNFKYVLSTFDVISRDFHCMYLIIPDQISYSKELGIYHKYGSQNKFTPFLLNHLYVNMSRATEKLIIYTKDPALYNYLQLKLNLLTSKDVNIKDKIVQEQKLNFVKSYSDKSKKNMLLDKLESFGFEGFIHATEYKNLLKILFENKLKSRNDLSGLFTDIADNSIIIRTSTFVTSKVRFYFTSLTPTLYHFNRRAENLVILVFDVRIIDDYSVYFSNGNAASKYTFITGEIQEALKFDWDGIFSNGPVNKTDYNIIRKRNAEFLVNGPVTVDKYIKKIVVKNEYLREELIKCFPKYSNKVIIDNGYFQ